MLLAAGQQAAAVASSSSTHALRRPPAARLSRQRCGAAAPAADTRHAAAAPPATTAVSNNAVPMLRGGAASAATATAAAAAGGVSAEPQQPQHALLRSPQAAPRGGSNAPAWQLTNTIMAADSWQALQQLHAQHAGSLNIIHVSAMLTRLTRCQHQQQQQGSRLALRAFLQQLEQLSLQLMASVEQLPQAAAAAVEVVHPGSGSSSRDGSSQLLFLQPPVPQTQLQQRKQSSHGGSSSSSTWQRPGTAVMPQQLANMAWCHATLGYQPSAVWWDAYWGASAPLLQTFNSRELANTIWAASKLQQTPPAAWMADFEAACVAGGGLAAATPQELCMLLRGVAVLRLSPSPAWVAALQSAVLDRLSCMAPRDICQMMWGHARLRLTPPPAWTHAVLSAVGQLAARFTVRDTAMLLWALATLQLLQAGGATACSSVEAQQQQQQRQQQQQQQWPVHGSATSLQAADSSLQLQQQVLVSQLLGNLQLSSYKLGAASAQDYAHIMWTLAVLHQRQQQEQPQQEQHGDLSQQLQQWCRLTWQLTLPGGSPGSSSRTAASGVTPTDAAQLLWAASQLGDEGCWPPGEWLQRYWAASTSSHDLYTSTTSSSSGPGALHLARASAHSLTVTMWAACKLRQPPPGHWLAAALPVLQQQLAELQPAAACQLLHVLARLQHHASPGFMQQLLSRLQLDSHQLQPRAFACVLWALARLRYHPGATWWATLLQHLAGLVPVMGQRELANVAYGLHALGVVPGAQLRAGLVRRAAELGVADNICFAGEEDEEETGLLSAVL